MPENIINADKYSEFCKNIDHLVTQNENILNDTSNVVKLKLRGEVLEMCDKDVFENIHFFPYSCYITS